MNNDKMKIIVFGLTNSCLINFNNRYDINSW